MFFFLQEATQIPTDRPCRSKFIWQEQVCLDFLALSSQTLKWKDSHLHGQVTVGRLKTTLDNWSFTSLTLEPELQRPLRFISLQNTLTQNKFWTETFLHTANIFKILYFENVYDLRFFIREVFKKHKAYSAVVF